MSPHTTIPVKLEQFTVTINTTTVQVSDPKPDARGLLVAAGFTPADECVLILHTDVETQAIGLDQLIDLREPNVKRFSAFRSDRIFRFTVDERGFDWGAETIAEPTLRELANIEQDDVLVLERENEADQLLDTHSMVRLADRGTEHLHVERGLVTVFFKDIPIELRRGVYTTEQLIAKFPIEPGYLLMLKTHEGDLVTLKVGQEIHVVDGLYFYSQLPCGGSS